MEILSGYITRYYMNLFFALLDLEHLKILKKFKIEKYKINQSCFIGAMANRVF